MPTVNLGRIGMIARGVYSPTETYARLDCVAYNGAAYCALKSVSGVTPSNDGVTWLLMVNSRSVEDTYINSAGELVITYNDGSSKNLGVVKGKDAPALTPAAIRTALGYTPADDLRVTDIADTAAMVNTRVDGIIADISPLPKLEREVSALKQLGEGVIYRFEADRSESFSGPAPTGALLASVNRIDGKTVHWNQLCIDPLLNAGTNMDVSNFSATYSQSGAHLVATKGSATTHYYRYKLPSGIITAGNRYVVIIDYIASTGAVMSLSARGDVTQAISNGKIFTASGNNTEIRLSIGAGSPGNFEIGEFLDIKLLCIINVTDIFGSGEVTDEQIDWIKRCAASNPEYSMGMDLHAAVTSVDIAQTRYAIPTAVTLLPDYGKTGSSIQRSGGRWTYATLLSDPIDITDMMGTALDSLTVSGDQIVTMANNAKIDVFREIEYLVRLSEV